MGINYIDTDMELSGKGPKVALFFFFFRAVLASQEN